MNSYKSSIKGCPVPRAVLVLIMVRDLQLVNFIEISVVVEQLAGSG